MNQIHGRFEIANEHFLYVLSPMVLEPVRWNERLGWRPLVENERLASFHFWREVGRRMAIREIPESYAELEAFNVEFERLQFGYTEAGARVAAATREMFLDWFPGLPKRAGRLLVHALLDDPLLDALGFPQPSHSFRRFAEAVVRARSRAVRALPARRRPRMRTGERHRSYPNGYELETARARLLWDQLGPVAQWIERQTSNLRAVVRFHPGPSWPTRTFRCSDRRNHAGRSASRSLSVT